ncbi:MAG: PadR family transcriptional regulator, regulatory protein PadR [Actinomycetota bacterium]|nr:PadR family transcriptional regulator, regulatory protein PadR [Actinomycetota bacterium]
MGGCEPRNFQRPCLLLLLQERPAHGYDLVERLHASFIDDTDTGGVYRTLRGLEREGLVRSSWCVSATGPARRTYALTPAGVEALEHQVETIGVTHELLHTFLDRCGRALHPMTAVSP